MILPVMHHIKQDPEHRVMQRIVQDDVVEVKWPTCTTNCEIHYQNTNNDKHVNMSALHQITMHALVDVDCKKIQERESDTSA